MVEVQTSTPILSYYISRQTVAIWAWFLFCDFGLVNVNSAPSPQSLGQCQRGTTPGWWGREWPQASWDSPDYALCPIRFTLNSLLPLLAWGWITEPLVGRSLPQSRALFEGIDVHKPLCLGWRKCLSLGESGWVETKAEQGTQSWVFSPLRYHRLRPRLGESSWGASTGEVTCEIWGEKENLPTFVLNTETAPERTWRMWQPSSWEADSAFPQGGSARGWAHWGLLIVPKEALQQCKGPVIM